MPRPTPSRCCRKRSTWPSAAGVYNTVQWATADLGLALLSLGRVDEAAAYFTRAGAARIRSATTPGQS